MTHREIKAPCSRCKGQVVTVSIKGTTYDCCGSMDCDLARVTKGLKGAELAESKRLVEMHNARLEKAGAK